MKEFLEKIINLGFSNANKELLITYFISQPHNVPLKVRFTKAAFKYLVKHVSEAVAVAFNLIYQQVENYNFKTYYF